MSIIIEPSIRCFLILPQSNYRQIILENIKRIAKENSIKISIIDNVSKSKFPFLDVVSSEIARCDFVIADVTQKDPNTLYEIGLSHAMGKFVAFIVDEKINELPINIEGGITFPFSLNDRGLDLLMNQLEKFFNDYIKYPRRFRPYRSIPIRLTQPPFIIDLDKLEPREFENLSFELIAQMGFRKVEWGKEFKEIDVVATLPKKDPDGYEYQELWLITMGRRVPVEMMLEMVLFEPENFLRRLLRYPEGLDELFNRYKIRSDVPITILFISQKGGQQQEYLDHEFRRFDRRLKERPYPFTFRIRVWDQMYLSNLIQQYSQIAYKYFSEESRIKSKYRKTPQEMYEENVQLNERLQITLTNLEEEKKKRFIAERNAAWKDVAFKAAHKLGNPIDAIDTFLQSLKKRISSKLLNEATDITNNMEVAVEESKTVIEQFKSLIKAQEINLKEIDIIPIIQQSTKVASESGVIVTMKVIENCPYLLIDPYRITECFNEMVANSLHWFNKPEKKIQIEILKPAKRELPEILGSSLSYLKIQFNDNGIGVPIENKEKIFAPFFTTYAHGTGLGLSLVKTIIEGHGGLIWENGKPNEGASFDIYLPIKKNRRK
jgi:signal transduction histidine kinase